MSSICYNFAFPHRSDCLKEMASIEREPSRYAHGGKAMSAMICLQSGFDDDWLMVM